MERTQRGTGSIPANWLHEASPAQFGLAAVEVAIAYEWLLSGLDKCFSGQYLNGLSSSLNDMSAGNPNTWYVGFLRHVAMPHSTFFGCLTAAGELAVGLALLAGAIFWLAGPSHFVGRPARLLQIAVIIGLASGTLMTANYYLLAGKTLPWLNPAHPFDEGLSLDGLLTLVGIGLIAVHLLALARTPAAGLGDQSLSLPHQSRQLAS